VAKAAGKVTLDRRRPVNMTVAARRSFAAGSGVAKAAGSSETCHDQGLRPRFGAWYGFCNDEQVHE
jgi:hypothetical protein